MIIIVKLVNDVRTNKSKDKNVGRQELLIF